MLAARMAVIRLDRVTKVFSGDVVAVDDVSLEIPDGEFIVLVGPSGCGKSTLLRMIAGLEEVTAGTVSIGGSDVTDLRAAPPRHRHGLPELRALSAHDRPPEPRLRAQGAADAEARDRAPRRRGRELLGLDELLDRRPAQLSGGQRQRVAMGRAIVREPQAFLMDEPLSNLDAKLRVGMRASLSQLHERLGVTTVYVTHDQVEAMTLGQRVAVMRDGRILQVDAPQTLYREPRDLFVAAFIGSPAMNLVEATLDGDDVTLRPVSACRSSRRRPPRGRRTGSCSASGRRPSRTRRSRPALPTIDVRRRGARGGRLRRPRVLLGRRAVDHRRDPRGATRTRCSPTATALFTARVDPRTRSARRRARSARGRPVAVPLLRSADGCQAAAASVADAAPAAAGCLAELSADAEPR